MRIHEEFYKEMKEEYDLAMEDEEDTPEADEGNADFQKWFYEGILAGRQAERRRRREAGELLKMSDFEFIERQLLELADRVGMDIDSDIQNGTGAVSLAAHHIDLHKSEEPELLTALADAIGRADYLRFDTAQRYGQTIMRMTVQYDLDI